jgi:hypothetical protein
MRLKENKMPTNCNLLNVQDGFENNVDYKANIKA